MDQNLVYAKTPSGDDVVRQSTRVVQRNLRLVLVQVDGKTSVAELAAKVGNVKLVENALRDLERGGFIAPVAEEPSVWEQGKRVAKGLREAAASQFSTFGTKSVLSVDTSAQSRLEPSAFSAFDDIDDQTRATSRPVEPFMGQRPAAAPGRTPDFDEELAPPSRRLGPMSVVRLVLGLLALVCVGAVFFPYNHFKPDIERALGQALRAPVRIGNVAVELLPRPALALQRLEIGRQGEASIDEVRIPSLLSLIGDHRMIPGIDVAGVAMPADGLGWLAAIGGDPEGRDAGFAVGHVRLQRVALRMGDTSLRHLEGEVLFKADGKIDKALLQTEDRALRIEAVPSAQGVMLNLEGYGWKPVEGAPYVFDAMQAKGLLQSGRLVLHDIDTTFLGGALKGSWLLDWSDGMAMAGEAALARMDARRVAATFAPLLKIEGELSGSMKMRGTGKDWQAMWGNAEAALDVDIARGVFDGIDLGEAARRGVGRNTRGGSTKFDRLRGALAIGPKQISGQEIRMEAGLISATGRFVADTEHRVDGIFDVRISSSVAGIRMPIRISGTLPDLIVSASR